MKQLIFLALLSLSNGILAAPVYQFKTITGKVQSCPEKGTNISHFVCWKSLFNEQNKKLKENYDKAFFQLTYDDQNILYKQWRNWHAMKNQKCKTLPATILLLHLESLQCHTMLTEAKALEFEFFASTL
jgi:uncharacterized protein YecT (DUF1311 family)